MGQAIWRYHPEQRRYEIFAEGGGNSFGVEIDSQGRIFSGHNGGDTRGFHFVQGGYYQKGFGKHGELSNPYAYGYFPQMKHPSVARFTHDLLVYEATTLPSEYHGQVFGVAPLQGQVTISERRVDGSSFQTQDVGHAFTTDDTWCRPVHIHLGPDGGIYVADFYEQRIDHSSHYQGRVDLGTGRIYRITSVNAPDHDRHDEGYARNLAELPSTELITLLHSNNRWLRQIVLRILGDRRDASVYASLKEWLETRDDQVALDALWALNLSGGFHEADADRFLEHPNPYVRLWTVRLLCDAGVISPDLTQRLATLAATETHLEVRSQLACSVRRLPSTQSLPIIRVLFSRSEDAADIHLPLLLWWALEANVGPALPEVLALFESGDLWQQPIVRQHVLERLMRRLAQSGTQRELLACARLLALAPERSHVDALLRGFEAAYQGRSLAALPEELVHALAASGGGSLTLRLRQRNPAAIEEALQIVANSAADRKLRMGLMAVLGEIDRPDSIPVLLGIFQSDANEEVRVAALLALQSYDATEIPKMVIDLHPSLPQKTRLAAQGLLASRQVWTLQLLEAVESQRIDPTDVDLEVIRKVLLHTHPDIAPLVAKHWGEVQGATTEQMKIEIERLTQVVQVASGNPYSGKRLYTANCGKCHVFFGEGSEIGPDLTNYQRSDLQRMLLNVVNPSIEIREGYENHVLATSDGRVLSGFVVDQDNRVVVLRGASGETHVISREEIEDMTAISRSLMPEGLLQSLNDQEIRDLFAYLRATQPLHD